MAAGPVRRPAAADGHRPGAGLRQLAVHRRRRRAGREIGQAEDDAAVVQAGQATAGGGQVRRRGQGPRPAALLDPGHGHGQRPVEVGTQAAGALAQPVGVAGRRT